MRFVLSAMSFVDISDLFRMSPKCLADNSAPFGMFKKMFADKSTVFGMFKKMFTDKFIAFGVFKNMFADNSDAFGMSLSRILLLQPFRSKFLFGVFALGAASTKQKTMAQSDGRLEDVKMNSRGLLSPRFLKYAQ